MTHIDFFLSYECMNNCIFCNYTFLIKHFKDYLYSFEEVVSLILQKRKEGFKSVNFTGGEPSLHKDFLKIIKLSKKIGYKVTVGTNLMRFVDDKFFRDAVPYIDEIVVAIHGHKQRLDFIHTRNKENFSSLLNALQKIEEYDGNINLITNTVLTNYNIDYIEDIINFITNYKKAKHIIISNISPEGNALKSYVQITPRLYQIREKIENIVKLVQKELILRFFTLPLCVLDKYRIYSDDLYMEPRITIERCKKNSKTTSSIKKTITTGRFRTKTEKCKECIYRNICGGIHIKYFNIYGDGELKPVL